MQAKNCKERIIRLKNRRVERRLTIDQVIELCGGFPSESTITKFFAKGCEDKSYRESTVAALEIVLFGEVYNAAISIPVEDVVEAQKEAAALAEKQARIQTLNLEQQRAKLRVCYVMLALFFVFDSVILLYDIRHPDLGFFSSPSTLVWYVQLGFLVALGITITVFFARYWLRKKELKSLEE